MSEVIPCPKCTSVLFNIMSDSVKCINCDHKMKSEQLAGMRADYHERAVIEMKHQRDLFFTTVLCGVCAYWAKSFDATTSNNKGRCAKFITGRVVTKYSHESCINGVLK